MLTCSILIPSIILVVYSTLSRKTIEPIILAVISAYIPKYGIHFPNHFLDGLYSTIANETIVLLLDMLSLFGGLIELITLSNGIHRISSFLKEKFIQRNQRLIFQESKSP